jgi:hypothetical protein
MAYTGQIEGTELSGDLARQGAFAGSPAQIVLGMSQLGDQRPERLNQRFWTTDISESDTCGQFARVQNEWSPAFGDLGPSRHKPAMRRPVFESLTVLKAISKEYLVKDQARLERNWLAIHRQEYAGEWIALLGDRLLSHSKNAKEVFLAARVAGAKALVLQIEGDQLPFAGW